MSLTSSPTIGQSQCAIILRLLLARPGEWISMVTLGTEAGGWAVHSRIADLRGKGYDIENRCEERDGKKHSFYRLVAHAPGNDQGPMTKAQGNPNHQ